MITVIYFLLLVAASVEDYKSRRVNQYLVSAVWLLGLINIVLEKDNRWVTVSLTCICFMLLYVCYVLVRHMAGRRNLGIQFGGADVRLIPAMMLVQGWDVALTGVFAGFVFAAGWYFIRGKRNREIPLVPWMSAGCLIVEIFYLFF